MRRQPPIAVITAATAERASLDTGQYPIFFAVLPPKIVSPETQALSISPATMVARSLSKPCNDLREGKR